MPPQSTRKGAGKAPRAQPNAIAIESSDRITRKPLRSSSVSQSSSRPRRRANSQATTRQLAQRHHMLARTTLAPRALIRFQCPFPIARSKVLSSIHPDVTIFDVSEMRNHIAGLTLVQALNACKADALQRTLISNVRTSMPGDSLPRDPHAHAKLSIDTSHGTLRQTLAPSSKRRLT